MYIGWSFQERLHLLSPTWVPFHCYDGAQWLTALPRTHGMERILQRKCRVALGQGLSNSSVKGQIINILGFMGYI